MCTAGMGDRPSLEHTFSWVLLKGSALHYLFAAWTQLSSVVQAFFIGLLAWFSPTLNRLLTFSVSLQIAAWTQLSFSSLCDWFSLNGHNVQCTLAQVIMCFGLSRPFMITCVPIPITCELDLRDARAQYPYLERSSLSLILYSLRS